MSTARQGLAVATGVDGHIYAIGGVNGTRLTTVEAYTPATNSWAAVASMPTARNGLAAATGSDGRIYAIGGWAGAPINTVEAYTPGTDSWAAVASMPTARNGLAAVTGADGRIYAMGGWDGSNRLNTVEAYTPSTNSWATVSPMPIGRQDFAAAAGPDGRIYVIGGVDNTGSDTSAVEVYTPSTDNWATVAPLPTLRYGLAAATGPDGRIYAIGGYGGPGYLNIVEAYTPGSNTWAGVAPMPTQRSELAAATASDGRIFAIGGAGYAGTLATVEAYDTGFVPPTRTTTTVASSSNPSTVGKSVTYTATVAPTPDGGSIGFTDNGTTLSGCGAVVVNASTGTAPCSTSYGSAGSHSIVASYSGDSKYAASSGSLTQQVNTATTYQESSPAVFCDTWGGVINDAASGGTYRSSSAKGATASFHFSGTGVTWVTRIAADQGIASVSIDGVSKGSFDLYASTPQNQVPETFSGLTSAAHKITIKVTGTKNAASTGTGVAVDAFIVGSTTIQDSSPKVAYDTWAGATSKSASGGAYRVSGKANATCGLTFSGTSVQWITATGPAYGEAEVIIDSVNKGTVDLYSPSVHWQVAETYAGLLSGTHTIVVKVLGIKNASSTGTKVVIDAFVVS
jgi:N-acetylneuraminic acid mutarotase